LPSFNRIEKLVEVVETLTTETPSFPAAPAGPGILDDPKPLNCAVPEKGNEVAPLKIKLPLLFTKLVVDVAG